VAKSSQSKTVAVRPAAKLAGPSRARARSNSVDAQALDDTTRLKAELEAARARIAELEAAQRLVLDRIAWAVDSLHTLLDDAPD
jgi:hypothetical protein